MKIIMLNYEFPPIGGGAGQAHQNILHQFAGFADLEIDVLTCGLERGVHLEQFSDNIRIYRVGISKKNLHYWLKSEVISWLWRAGKVYRQMLKENKYDLAHAFFGFPTGYLPYKNADKIPYIISLRGSDVPGYNIRLGLDYLLLAGLFRRIWTKAAAVVANSRGLSDLGRRFMPSIEIPIITNGIDMRRFYAPGNKQIGQPVKLLTVCRLISRKRIDLLITAVKHCCEAGCDVELNIAGQGNMMAELKLLALSLGISDRVNFLGLVEAKDMPEVYRQNDIFVMSSAHEGMSNAMLEAMACGLPIVTTHCEGVDELIDGNGIVAAPTPMSIATAVKDMLEDKEAYESMRQRSTQQAEKFSWQSTADNYYRLYQSII